MRLSLVVASELALARGVPHRDTARVLARQLTASHTWFAPAGEALTAHVGDWLLTDGFREWSVREEIFARSYEARPQGLWVKSVPTYLLRMEEPFCVETLEGLASGAAGDYLAAGPAGDAWPLPAALVRRYARL